MYVQLALAAYTGYEAYSSSQRARKANRIKKKQADLDNYIARRKKKAEARAMQGNVANVAAQTGQAGGSGAIGASSSIASQEAAAVGTSFQQSDMDRSLNSIRQRQQRSDSNVAMASVAGRTLEAYSDATMVQEADPVDLRSTINGTQTKATTQNRGFSSIIDPMYNRSQGFDEAPNLW